MSLENSKGTGRADRLSLPQERASAAARSCCRICSFMGEQGLVQPLQDRAWTPSATEDTGSAPDTPVPV